MMKCNEDVRNAIKGAGVKHWQVAEALKVHENQFSRELRHELTPERKKQVFAVIAELQEKETGSGIE